jgi:methyltransferase
MSAATSLYLAFVAAAVGLSVLERRAALRNERRLLAEGGKEVAPLVFSFMVPVYALHFPAAAFEHVALARRPPIAWVAAMVLLFAASKWLKRAAVRALGDAWTMRVVVPVTPRVAVSGPYRRLRHPNYVAVMGELIALPLAGGAWITALVFGAAFSVVLAARVRTEEAALLARAEYALAMADRPRFLPGAGARSCE